MARKLLRRMARRLMRRMVERKRHKLDHQHQQTVYHEQGLMAFSPIVSIHGRRFLHPLAVEVDDILIC